MIYDSPSAGWNNPPRRAAIAGKLDIDKLSYLMDIAADLNFLLSEPLAG
jgi:hypothetical protein